MIFFILVYQLELIYFSHFSGQRLEPIFQISHFHWARSDSMWDWRVRYLKFLCLTDPILQCSLSAFWFTYFSSDICRQLTVWNARAMCICTPAMFYLNILIGSKSALHYNLFVDLSCQISMYQKLNSALLLTIPELLSCPWSLLAIVHGKWGLATG